MDNRIDIQLLQAQLKLSECYQFVQDENCGGLNVFIGNVRKWNKGKQVSHLIFEAYEAMAISELHKIAHKAIENFGISKISIHHRLGKVDLNQTAVIIAVSDKHRSKAFEACQYAIDELKKHVPIWKKEHLIDGSYWVNARP